MSSDKISNSTLQDFNILGMSHMEFGIHALKMGEDWRKITPS